MLAAGPAAAEGDADDAGDLDEPGGDAARVHPPILPRFPAAPSTPFPTPVIKHFGDQALLSTSA
ncbi:hypothetical protein GCM10009528_39920 [Kineococcus aurantiacus]